MAKPSAGLLMYRRRDGRVEVLLVHPGGPFWKSRDIGAWSIPKGEFEPDEDPLAAARREFREETGMDAGRPLLELGAVRQKSGKTVHAWAFEGDCRPEEVQSNTFTMEWPPHSGEQREFPEIDRAAFWPLDKARKKINAGQAELLDRLVRLLAEA